MSQLAFASSSLSLKHFLVKQSSQQLAILKLKQDYQSLRQVNPNTPRTQAACEHFGIDLKSLKMKKPEDFDKPGLLKEIKDMRFDHYLRSYNQDIKNIIKFKQINFDNLNVKKKIGIAERSIYSVSGRSKNIEEDFKLSKSLSMRSFQNSRDKSLSQPHYKYNIFKILECEKKRKEGKQKLNLKMIKTEEVIKRKNQIMETKKNQQTQKYKKQLDKIKTIQTQFQKEQKEKRKKINASIQRHQDRTKQIENIQKQQRKEIQKVIREKEEKKYQEFIGQQQLEESFIKQQLCQIERKFIKSAELNEKFKRQRQIKANNSLKRVKSLDFFER